MPLFTDKHKGLLFFNTGKSRNTPGILTLCKFKGKDTKYQQAPETEDAKELDANSVPA